MLWHNRGVAVEGSGGSEHPRNLADQLTLFKLMGEDYAPHYIASPLPPPGNKKGIYTK